MAVKSWKILKQNNQAAKEIAATFQIPQFLADILINRGFQDVEDIVNFLNPSAALLGDTFQINGMQKAVERIQKAIEKHEIVTIYGDYDVDGITSVSLLFRYLSGRGLKIFNYIPDRLTEGYGIHIEAIDKIAANGSSLIISVDTGITACAEVEYAKTLGIDFIITDHHECGSSVPNAYAVCNPKQKNCGYPFKALAGVGVVFKLICALSAPEKPDEILKQYGDLIALGTISDVMPIVGENRYIVKQGLQVLSQNQTGLRVLMQQAGIRNIAEISVFDVSFLLAPRINAAGRIGDPMLAVELLTTKDEARMSEIAAYLCETNNRRQQIECEIFAQAEAIIQDKKLYKDQSIMVLWKENWHHGVIGIVASRIKEKYGLPTILFSVADGKAKGSGRSVEPLNLYDTLSELSAPWFQFGGHALAAGITMEAKNLPRFKDLINNYVKSFIAQKPYVNEITVDAVMQEKDFSISSFQSVFMLEPFGCKNDAPLFCVRSAHIQSITPIGNGKHLRLMLKVGSKTLSAVYFGISVNDFGYERGEYIDILFQASVNEFRGKKEIQLIVKAVRPYENKYHQLLGDYNDALCLNIRNRKVPGRKEITSVYRFCRYAIQLSLTSLELLLLPHFIDKAGYGKMTLFQITVCLTILKEIGVLDFTVLEEKFLLISVNESKKVSLNDSETYCKIQG